MQQRKQHTSGSHLVRGMLRLLNMPLNHGLVPVLKFAAFHWTFPFGKLVVLENQSQSAWKGR